MPSSFAEQIDDAEARVHALNTIGTTELLTGNPAGRAKLEQSLELSRQLAAPDSVGRAFVHLLQVGAHRRAYELADRYFEPAIAYVGERGLDLWRSYLFAFRAKIMLDRGQWDDAVELATLVFQKRVISTFPRTVGSVVLGLVRARRGEPDANSHLEAAFALAEPTGELLRIAPAATAGGGGRVARRRPRTGSRGDACCLRARCPVAAPTGPSESSPYWRWRAGLLCYRGAGSGRSNRTPLVSGDLSRAAELWTALGCPYEAAWALADADDEANLRRALEAFERLGAKPAAAMVAARLG